jgi:hypothetical protein
MKLSKSERHSLYLIMWAESYYGYNYSGLCEMVDDLCDDEAIMPIYIKYDLPELWELNPREIAFGYYWFYPYDWKPRRKLLLKAIEMSAPTK